MKRIILIGLLCLISVFGWGADYYIDPGGDDGTGDGSPGNPWYELSYACSQATSSGDVIHINAGAYTDTSYCDLSVGVDIEGAGKATVTINVSVGHATHGAYINAWSNSETTGNHEIHDFTIDGGDTGALRGIRTRERHNVQIYNMGIVDFGSSGIRVEGEPDTTDATEPAYYATGIVIRDNTITNVAQDGISRAGITIESLQGALIYNNVIDETAVGNNRGMKICQYGWYRDVKIYDNTISTTPGDGNAFVIELYFFLDDSEIYGNTFNGPLSLNAGLATRVGGSDWNLKIHDNTFDMSTWTAGTFLELSHHCLDFYNNYVIGNATLVQGLGIWTSNYTTAASVDHVKIRNNVIYNTAITGIYIDKNAVAYDDIEIYNNVVDTVATVGWGGYGISVLGNSTVTNLIVKNNIVLNTDSYWLDLQTGVDSAVATYNMKYGNGQSNNHRDTGSGNTVSDNLSTDPDIVAVGDRPGYYYPSSGSSNLVDSGASLTGENDVDYNGVSRPQGAAWDIGAYEYVAFDIPRSRYKKGLPSLLATAQVWGFWGLYLLNIYLLIALLRTYRKMKYWKGRALFYENSDNLNAMSEINKYLEGENNG